MKNIFLFAICTAFIILLNSCATPPAEGTKFNFSSEDPYRQGQNLVEAIAHGENTAAYRLMERGAPLNYQDKKDEWTPVTYAIYYKEWMLARVLIRTGVNVNIADSANRTPLMWCAMRNSIITARLLVEYGADINAVDIGGRTALQYAIIYENGFLAAYLARAGRIPSAKRIKKEHLARLKLEREKAKAIAENIKLFGTKYEKAVVGQLKTEKINKAIKGPKPKAAITAEKVMKAIVGKSEDTTAPLKKVAPVKAKAPVKIPVKTPVKILKVVPLKAPLKALRKTAPVKAVKAKTPVKTVTPKKDESSVKSTILNQVN